VEELFGFSFIFGLVKRQKLNVEFKILIEVLAGKVEEIGQVQAALHTFAESVVDTERSQSDSLALIFKLFQAQGKRLLGQHFSEQFDRQLINASHVLFDSQ
jgi:hypothetical protein